MSQDFFRGIKAAIPPCLGVIPIAVSIGLLGMQQAHLSAWETIFMSATVMAGAAQLMAIGMIADGAGAWAIVLATFFINFRLIVMSSSTMQALKDKTTVGQRLLGSLAFCDESFAVFSLSGKGSLHFLFGANFILWVGFLLATIVGCLLTEFLPPLVIQSFCIAFYAAFLALLLPSIKHRWRLIALVILTALLNSLFYLLMPSSWALVVSMLLAAAIGVFFVRDEDIG
jgi:predicted branched-subunit amino acid permease